jgi:predicted SnoaL-like aldol condensation-catalyzing enzyme
MSREIEEQNLKTIQALFAATGSGDWPAAEAMLTDDFFVTEAPGNPFAGVYRGRSALQKLFTEVVGAAGVTKMDVKQLTAGGDLVIAIVEMTLGGPPERSVSLAEMFRIRNDKVCEIKPHYFDSAPLASAVAGKKRA